MRAKKQSAKAVRVTPLDGASQALGEALNARRMESGWEIELGSVPTVQYLVEVLRQ